MSLPEAFLAQRREVMLVAQRRVFLGSTEPLPEMPFWPGIYNPRPQWVPPQQSHHLTREKAPRRVWARRKSAGDLPVGLVVKTYFGHGVIMGYIDIGVDPMRFVPPGTPIWQLSGCRVHHPSNFTRYVIKTTRDKHPWYLFTKCLTLEKSVEKEMQ